MLTRARERAAFRGATNRIFARRPGQLVQFKRMSAQLAHQRMHILQAASKVLQTHAASGGNQHRQAGRPRATVAHTCHNTSFVPCAAVPIKKIRLPTDISSTRVNPCDANVVKETNAIMQLRCYYSIQINGTRTLRTRNDSVREKAWRYQIMRMRSKAWLAARVSLRLARCLALQAGCGARVAYAPRLRLCQAFSRMLW